MESTPSSPRDRSSPRRDWDEVADVVERCRAYWLLSEVAAPVADDMAAELEAHLREQLAAGGSIERVVGVDMAGFAEDWATSRRSRAPARLRVPRALSAPLTAVATYALVGHLVDLLAGAGAVLAVRASDLVGAALVVAVSLVLVNPPTLRVALVRRTDGPLALLGLAAVATPVAVPVATRTVVAVGPTLLHLTWPVTVLLVAAAILATAGGGPRFDSTHGRPPPDIARGIRRPRM